jgi:hypothetical protein
MVERYIEYQNFESPCQDLAYSLAHIIGQHSLYKINAKNTSHRLRLA